ncbi:MAG: tyrosine-type recombinase/integrase [Chloroflexi bacterium]|nr:tyrosine-type recombinase/integrase [Chloroflexota bacterium]
MFGKELDAALEEWLTFREAEGLSPSTIRSYHDHIRIFVRVLGERELTPFTFAAVFREYAQEHAVASCQTIYTSVKVFLKGIDHLDLAGSMRKPRGTVPAKQIYTDGQLRALFGVLQEDRSPLGVRDYAIVCLLRYGGLRASEVCNLRLDDFRDREDAIQVAGTKSRYSRRVIPLVLPCSQALSVYLGRGRPKLVRAAGGHTDHVFLTATGRALSRNTVRLMLRRRSLEVGFALSSHRFRHTWATAHVGARTSPTAIGHLAGWSPKTLYEMMHLYAHPDADMLREAQERAFGR